MYATVRPERWAVLDVEQRLHDIRARYGKLLARPRAMKGRIKNDILSPVYLYVDVPPDRDSRTLALFSQQLDFF